MRVGKLKYFESFVQPGPNCTMNNHKEITRISKHLLSLIAPQHPQKEIKKTMHPATITRMGIVSITGINSRTSPSCTSTAVPTPMKARPANCDKKKVSYLQHLHTITFI